MKTKNMVDKDQLIQQLEDQFWDERENHKAHAKLLFGEIVTLKEENAALKETLTELGEIMQWVDKDTFTKQGKEHVQSILNKASKLILL